MKPFAYGGYGDDTAQLFCATIQGFKYGSRPNECEGDGSSRLIQEHDEMSGERNCRDRGQARKYCLQIGINSRATNEPGTSMTSVMFITSATNIQRVGSLYTSR